MNKEPKISKQKELKGNEVLSILEWIRNDRLGFLELVFDNDGEISAIPLKMEDIFKEGNYNIAARMRVGKSLNGNKSPRVLEFIYHDKSYTARVFDYSNIPDEIIAKDLNGEVDRVSALRGACKIASDFIENI